jgi:hypothetical protein
MGFWIGMFVPDDSIERCGPMPDDIVEMNRPKRFDRTPNHDLVVPQLGSTRGPFRPFDGSPLSVGDNFFRPQRITARVGETITWSFDGQLPHSVTVANGPRGFSSVYLGRTSGTYSATPQVPGTYRLTCLVHPMSMAQTLVVK